MSNDVSSIAVIGAGTMGSGISLVAATSGIDAFQVDVSTDQLDRARKYHDKVLSRNVEKGRMTEEEKVAALGRITYWGHGGGEDGRLGGRGRHRESDIKAKIFVAMKETFPSRGARDEHGLDLDHPDRDRDGRCGGPGRRHALLQPGPGDEARRGHQGARHQRETVARTIALAER